MKAYFRDNLKIYYFLILEDFAVQDYSPFQGFSRGWRDVMWALDVLAELPADVLEGLAPLNGLISQRMGAARKLSWLPLNASALRETDAAQLSVFMVCFSGATSVAHDVQDWISRQKRPVLHISTIEGLGAVHPRDVSVEVIRDYCRAAFKISINEFTPERRSTAATALAGWTRREPIPLALQAHGHNTVHPNHMVLRRANRTLAQGKPFVGANEDEYAKIIIESAAEVVKLREDVGLRDFHRAFLVHPSLILTEPALYRHIYARQSANSSREGRMLDKVLRVFQKQRGHVAEVDEEMGRRLVSDGSHQFVVGMRKWELDAHTLGVGLSAAQTCSAVVRLSPGVNHVFPALSAYARNVRSTNAHARRKSRRLFRDIQHQLVAAIGPRRMAFIEAVEGPVKIIADAPIEWLPIGNLPLVLRHNCARVNATPGNLMMGLLTAVEVITLPIEAVQKVLVLSCLAPGDPLKNVLVGSIMAIKKQWEGKVDVVVKYAQTVDEFVEAIKAFDGSVMVFDGHGVINHQDPVGYLLIGKEKVDVWQLRERVRVPPIVMLSACDTHGVDSSSHATVGNGFLALGARTVLATLLPVDGFSSGSLMARFIYRLADFLPSLTDLAKRALNRTEIVSGMLRIRCHRPGDRPGSCAAGIRRPTPPAPPSAAPRAARRQSSLLPLWEKVPRRGG